MKDFGLYLATEHLKTDYQFFIIAALEKNKNGELSVKVMTSLDFKNENSEIINKEIASKMIEHLKQYV